MTNDIEPLSKSLHYVNLHFIKQGYNGQNNELSLFRSVADFHITSGNGELYEG